MVASPKTFCSWPGCRVLITVGTGGKCPEHAVKARQDYERHRSKRRGSSTSRGYGAAWNRASAKYRKLHPICVACAIAGRIQPAKLTDHVIPKHSVPSLFWDEDNWAVTCQGCHNYKSKNEPDERCVWIPRDDRVVVFGVDASRNTAVGKSFGWPSWDIANHAGAAEQVVGSRDAWVAAQAGAMVVVVSRPLAASLVAHKVQGRVLHVTEFTTVTGIR